MTINVYGQSKIGKITVYQDPRIGLMIEKHKDINSNKTKMQGYRIQIIASYKSQPVKDARGKFVSNYQDTKAYFIYQQPYYKLRIGDFQSRLEAQKLLDKISNVFQGAFIVPDKINISD